MPDTDGVSDRYDIATDKTNPISAVVAVTLAEQHALLTAALASIALDIAE